MILSAFNSSEINICHRGRVSSWWTAKGDLSFGRGYTKQKGCSIGELLNMWTVGDRPCFGMMYGWGHLLLSASSGGYSIFAKILMFQFVYITQMKKFIDPQLIYFKLSSFSVTAIVKTNLQNIPPRLFHPQKRIWQLCHHRFLPKARKGLPSACISGLSPADAMIRTSGNERQS